MPSCLPEDIERYRHYLDSPHFQEWWGDLGLDDNESIYGIIPFYEKYCKKQVQAMKVVDKEREIKYCWITLQNFKQRICDIDKFILFAKKIEYLYHDGYWVLESGKADPPNIHFHCLVKIINPKKHKQQLGIAWENIFGNNILEKDFYKLTQHRNCKGMPKYEDWCKEKLTYMNNVEKGDHANLVDLGISGRWGAGDFG